jgi:hypothetical protein
VVNFLDLISIVGSRCTDSLTNWVADGPYLPDAKYPRAGDPADRELLRVPFDDPTLHIIAPLDLIHDPLVGGLHLPYILPELLEVA